ncbi:putative Tigger transposable element-derived protein 1-like 273 [Homarus americanus]|uniref:Putative Tigger transposable element-derived protein 1-like 273 n=1 Tax=Homarus americanus TaxID=6706 RepID=A0A8J5JVC0_HOMAM|nr:putative Tigger transposable element-derived protein 1-like 273 [Homarus americanus]
MPAENRDILSLARQAGFDELESEDIEDVLVSHTEELTNEDLHQLTEHSPVEDDDDDEEESQRTLTSKRLAESLNMFQQAMQVPPDDDPNGEHDPSDALNPMTSVDGGDGHAFNDKVLVHWDGKLMDTLDSKGTDDRLPILVSGVNGQSFLESHLFRI